MQNSISYKNAVSVIHADGSKSFYKSKDGTPESNGAALNAAFAALESGDKIITSPGEVYSITKVSISEKHDITWLGNKAKVIPADSPYNNIIYISSSNRWRIYDLDFDGLSENYDSFELDSLDPDYSIEAKFVSKNNNPSPQGTTSTAGGRFFMLSGCCDFEFSGLYCTGNSVAIPGSGDFPRMWSADAIYFAGGKNHTVRNSYFYRCGYSGIHAETHNMNIENSTFHNVLWHGVVANSQQAGHTIHLKNVEFRKEGSYHMPAVGGFDLNAPDTYDECSLTSVTLSSTGYLPGGKAWVTGEAGITIGDYRYANSKWYYATSNGTTGGSTPSHSTGTVSDGGVSWAYVSPYSGVSPIKGGACKDFVLDGCSFNMGSSATGGATRSFAVQDYSETIIINNCWFSHSLQDLTLDQPIRKLVLKNTTIGALQQEGFGIWFDCLDTLIEGCTFNFTSRCFATKSTAADRTYRITNNLLVPAQTVSSNTLIFSDFDDCLQNGNMKFYNNKILDTSGEQIYPTHFTDDGARYHRLCNSNLGRLLTNQDENGNFVWDPDNMSGGVFGVPSAGDADAWFPGISGYLGVQIKNGKYNPNGSEVYSPYPAWTWSVDASGWVPDTGAPRKELSNDLGNLSGSVIIDLDAGVGDVNFGTLVGTVSDLTFTGDRTGEYYVGLIQDNSGGHNVVFSNLTNSSPTISATGNETTLIRVFRDPANRFFATAF